MYNGWGSIYWDSSVGDTAAWGLYLQQVGVADQPLVDEFTTNYIVGGENLCLAPSFDNYTSEMGAISGITSPSQGSAVFNGTTDYISLNPNLDKQLNEDFTISTWINTGATTTQAIINSITNANTKIIAGIRFSDLGFWLGVDNGAVTWAKSNSALNTGEWYYCTATFDSSSNTIKVYINGSDTTTGSGSIAGFGSVVGEVVIGKRNGNNDSYMNGNLANVAIWNRALTSDEINSVMWKQYQDLNTQEINGLQAWYSLDSTEVFDWYGYARNQGAVIEGRTCVDNALNALAQL